MLNDQYWEGIMFRSRRNREIEFDLVPVRFDREGAPLDVAFDLIFRKYKVDRFRIAPNYAKFYTVFDSYEGYKNFSHYAAGKEQIKIWLPKGCSNV